MLESLAPGLVPGIAQGLSGRRGNAASTAVASGESETVRGPVLLSRSLSSCASRRTSSQRSVRISLRGSR